MDQIPFRETQTTRADGIQDSQEFQHDDSARHTRHVDHVVPAQCARSYDVSTSQCSVLVLTGASELELDDAVLLFAAGKSDVAVLRYWVDRCGDDSGELCVSRSPCTQEEVRWSRGKVSEREGLSDVAGRIALARDECCLTCMVKHDAGSVLQHYSDYSTLLVVLPAGMEAEPVVSYLREQCSLDMALHEVLDDSMAADDEARLAPVMIRGIVSVAHAGGLGYRLFDDSPFVFGEGVEDFSDDRSNGGVAIRLLHEADHLVILDDSCAGGADAVDAELPHELLRLLMPSGGVLHPDGRSVSLSELVAGDCAMHDRYGVAEVLPQRGYSYDMQSRDVLCDGVSHVDDVALRQTVTDGENGRMDMASFGRHVLALSVRTPRPFHPGRLSDFLAADHQPMHIQAHFRVPTRPFSSFVWECEPNGSQIEQVPDDCDALASDSVTELFLIASCKNVHQEGAALARAIEDLMLDDREMHRQVVDWMGQSDEFTQWAAGAPLDSDQG
jgi:hypothetical protein